MPWQGYFVLAVVAWIILSLLFEWFSVDATLISGVAVVVIAGIIDLEQAIRGFANPTLVALGSLYIVAAAMRETGILVVAADYLLGRARSVRLVIARICAAVTSGSAFFNNTPIVAMGIPAIRSWCRKNDVAASKLLIPLSYASIFGGVCTLIGTSTNLVTDGLLRSDGYEGFGFFELSYAGIPCAIAGWMFLIALAPILLVDRESAVPDERLAGDGSASYGADGERETHQVVVRESSRLVGTRVGDADFEERYDAQVVSVVRDGREIDGELADAVLEAGDTLVLDTGTGFRDAFEDVGDFYVTTQVGGADEEASPADLAELDGTGVWLSVGTLAGIIALAAGGLVHISVAAMLGATVLVVAGVIDAGEARDAVDWKVLIVIGAAIGLGEAMEVSGAAQWVGHGIVEMGATFGSIGLLAAVVVGSSVLSQVITNYGSVALFFPIAVSISESQGLPIRPLVMGMSIAAALSFTIPIYQTNLMVYSAGNYRLEDFVRIGLPLQFTSWFVLIAVLAWGWGLGF